MDMELTPLISNDMEIDPGDSVNVTSPLEALKTDRILSKIFSYLGGKDLKSCRRVSKLWDTNASRFFGRETQIRVNLVPRESHSLSLTFNRYTHKAIMAINNSKSISGDELLKLLEKRVRSSAESLLRLRLYSLTYAEVESYVIQRQVKNFLGALTLDIKRKWIHQLFETVIQLPELKQLQVCIVTVSAEAEMATVIPDAAGESKRCATKNSKLEAIQLTVMAAEDVAEFVSVFVPSCNALKEFVYAGPEGANLEMLIALHRWYSGPGLRVVHCKTQNSYRLSTSTKLDQVLDLAVTKFGSSQIHLNLRNLPPLQLEQWQEILWTRPAIFYYKLETIELEIQEILQEPYYEFMEAPNSLKDPGYLAPKLFPLNQRNNGIVFAPHPVYSKLSRIVLSSPTIPLEVWERRRGRLCPVKASIALRHGESIPYLGKDRTLESLTLRLPVCAPRSLSIALKELPYYLRIFSIETCCKRLAWIRDSHLIGTNAIIRLPELRVLNIGVDCSNLTDEVILKGFMKMQALKELRLTGKPCFTREAELELQTKLNIYHVRPNPEEQS